MYRAKINEDRPIYYMQQKCSPGTLYISIRFMRIFPKVPYRERASNGIGMIGSKTEIFHDFSHRMQVTATGDYKMLTVY